MQSQVGGIDGKVERNAKSVAEKGPKAEQNRKMRRELQKLDARYMYIVRADAAADAIADAGLGRWSAITYLS